MITVNAVFGQEQKSLGTLGRVGENETRQIVFDCSDILAEYPGAEIVCVMQRHCDRTAYLADAVLDGNALTVTLTDADVSAPGDLRIELRALTDGKIRKSAVYMGQVVSALRGEQDRPGNPTADVLNRIDMTISRAEKSIAEADAAAQSAREVADTVQAKLDNGDFVGEKGDKGDPGDVQDVRVAGVSVLKDGVANVPIATADAPGVVSVLTPQDSGIWNDNGKLIISYATDAEISGRNGTRKSIVCANMDYAVRAAMCDGKGAAWTSDEQAAARERMAVENGADFELLVDATLEEEVNTFTVVFTKPVRECVYHIWFYNNNNSRVIAQTKCLESNTTKFYLLKYTANIDNGTGYVLNGYFRYNGPIFSRSIIGYACDSSTPSWTTDNPGNGNIAYINYPTVMSLGKVDGLSFNLVDKSHVLNVGAKIKVWGR